MYNGSLDGNLMNYNNTLQDNRLSSIAVEDSPFLVYLWLSRICMSRLLVK